LAISIRFWLASLAQAPPHLARGDAQQSFGAKSNRRRKQTLRKRFAVLLLGLLLFGCSDPYGACEKAALDIANGIAAGMKAVDQLRVAGTISVQEETNILGYLEFANKGNGAFGACAQAAHTAGSKAGSYTACATDFQKALADPAQLALIHVSNPTAQQNVQIIVAGVNTGVSAILAALGGK
jgi:hypothetical protein